MALFVDESIHDREDFIVAALLEAEDDVKVTIGEALRASGLVPGVDEFKAGAYMHGRAHLQELRTRLLNIVVARCRVALVIAPCKSRRVLGTHIIEAIRTLRARNALAGAPLVFVDEGISGFPAAESGEEVFISQDSRINLPLQLADVIAYYGAFLLLEEIYGPRKLAFVGPSQGFDPGFDAELGWIIKTQLRRSFFMQDKEWNEGKEGDEFFYRDLLGYGVFTVQGLSSHMHKTVEAVYGSTWIGCIH